MEGSMSAPKRSSRSSGGSYEALDLGQSRHANMMMHKSTTDLVETSLENSNPFLQRRLDPFPSGIKFLEVKPGKKASYRSLSLWSLHAELVNEIKQIDDMEEISPANTNRSRSQSTYCLADFRIRDLRWLESYVLDQKLTILVRRHLVIIVLDPIRALVMADKLILIVPPGADSLLGILHNFMSEWVPEAIINDTRVSIPFEFHAFEAVLTSVLALQSQQLEELQSNSHLLLSHMRELSMVPLKIQEQMRELKNSVSRMACNVINYQSALDELIMQDEEMALMNLSALKLNPSLYCTPLGEEIMSMHEEVEELLQSYNMQYTALASKLHVLQAEITNAEDLVSLRLDTSRNELLIANTAFSLRALCVGIGGWLAGVFGMNLDNAAAMESIPGLFFLIFFGTIGLVIMIYVGIYSYLTVSGVIPQKTVITSTKRLWFL